MLVDYRCPKCNQVMLGAKSEVEIQETEPVETAECGTCGTTSGVVWDEELGTYYYDDEVNHE